MPKGGFQTPHLSDLTPVVPKLPPAGLTQLLFEQTQLAAPICKREQQPAQIGVAGPDLGFHGGDLRPAAGDFMQPPTSMPARSRAVGSGFSTA